MRVGCLLACLAVLLAPAAAAGAPKVAVSINPIHSLVAAVMAGIAEPEVIVRGGASPHTYALRPSDARAIEQADLVVWVGPGLERFLVKPLAGPAKRGRTLVLAKLPGLTVLPAREGGNWDGHDDHGHAHRHGHDDDETDFHIWLDPQNAIRIIAHVAAVLGERDSANRAAYQRNAAAATARLTELDSALRTALAPVRTAPFIVFHDAYQYLERRYELNAVGSVTVSPERQPGAKRLAALRHKVVSLGARCVFAEPQFEPALVRTLIEGTPARTGTLDPNGAALTPGPDLYPAMIRSIADSLVACLGPG